MSIDQLVRQNRAKFAPYTYGNHAAYLSTFWRIFMNRFTNQSVLVTGGTSGIGLAAAQAFINEGATVYVTGRDAASIASAQAQLGAKAVVIASDAAAGGDAKALGATLLAKNVQLSAVFINAGMAQMTPFADVDEAFWDRQFAVNVKGAYFQIQALLPVLAKGASIVLNGSVNAHIGMPGTSVYAATKAALISLAKTLSAELLPRGVRVNVVSPGPIETPLYGKLGMDAATLQSVAAQIQNQVPLGRFGTANEVASTVLHLSAPESAFIVGTEILVDGGMSQL
jgi:NAD(P)-dependent dehydrogenase (short-subunit alcohol dehydrogenase family)